MKKQFLILAFFTLAILAGTNTAWGQLIPGVTAPAPGPNQPITPISCVATASALNPVPGVPFTYAMDNGSGATSLNWTWWATQDIKFIPSEGNNNLSTLLKSPQTVTAGVGTDLIATSAEPIYGVDNSTGVAGGANQVSITWSPDILAKTKYRATAADNTAGKFSTFVVAYSEGLAGCTDNIQVFEINPQPNFTIDIAAIDAAGVTQGWDNNTVNECVDQVQSASYNVGAGTITVDYGTNEIYYEVAAANFVNDFAPAFTIMPGSLLTDQTATISIYASYANATTNTSPLWTSAAIGIGGLNTLIRTNTSLDATNAGDVPIGVSFYVKVVIDNNTEETLAPLPFMLAVDAYDNTTAGVETAGASVWDMEDEDCNPSPDVDDDQVDRETITITPRPTMQMTPGTTTLEPNTILDDDVINKLP